MREELQKFTNKLRALSPAPDEDLVAELYELVEPIEQLPGAEAVIPEIFAFMERCLERDIGSPGPLVHFIERFYPSYLEQLIASIERQPTPHTLWMLNRILNSRLSAEQRERLMQVLLSAKSHPRASLSTKAEAAQFLEHRAQNG